MFAHTLGTDAANLQARVQHHSDSELTINNIFIQILKTNVNTNQKCLDRVYFYTVN